MERPRARESSRAAAGPSATRRGAAGPSAAARPSAMDRAVAQALWSALRTFGEIPGARVLDLPDASLTLTGTAYANLNNVTATAIADDRVEERIREILAMCAPDHLPVTWWVGPTTRPGNLAGWLQRLGLARQEPEFGMLLDLSMGWPHAPLPPHAALESVERRDQLDEWMGVMNAAYASGDQRRTALVLAMYEVDLARPVDQREIHHFLVRLHGHPSACSSLFVKDGEAFVTNIGTAPGARGRGLGTAATVATLELARALGRSSATLTASLGGRSVYRRLGFIEASVIDRYVATRETLAQLTAAGERRPA